MTFGQFYTKRLSGIYNAIIVFHPLSEDELNQLTQHFESIETTLKNIPSLNADVNSKDDTLVSRLQERAMENIN